MESTSKSVLPNKQKKKKKIFSNLQVGSENMCMKLDVRFRKSGFFMV
jgi:hypothetical protein